MSLFFACFFSFCHHIDWIESKKEREIGEQVPRATLALAFIFKQLKYTGKLSRPGRFALINFEFVSHIPVAFLESPHLLSVDFLRALLVSVHRQIYTESYTQVHDCWFPNSSRSRYVWLKNLAIAITCAVIWKRCEIRKWTCCMQSLAKTCEVNTRAILPSGSFIFI